MIGTFIYYRVSLHYKINLENVFIYQSKEFFCCLRKCIFSDCLIILSFMKLYHLKYLAFENIF